MPSLSVTYANETRTIECSPAQVLGQVISESNFPLEQPCAGRGTCDKCKAIAEGALSPLDDVELQHLLPSEKAANVRLACRVRVVGDAQVTLMPIVLYSNKIFTRSNEFRSNADPLGLAIDLGSTTVAAFLVSLETGAVYAGGGALNQQTVFGADVIARLLAAETNALRLSALAQASIYQAISTLHLSRRVLARIERVVIVGNSAMHHLLMQYPTQSLATLPFEPLYPASIHDAGDFFGNLFPTHARISLPPLIGGFVGSDTTACLAQFDFDRAHVPMLAIDLGTNGEVMATNGSDILVASTAAGPAFEGVNISCGTRAVDGAIVDADVRDGQLQVTTIGNCPPVGIAGSGLFSLVYALRGVEVIDRSGRLSNNCSGIPIDRSNGNVACVRINERAALTQWDIRELQKAKAAIRVAADLLLERPNVAPRDLRRVILTGSFGSQLKLEALLHLGLIPPINPDRIELVANGAGLGAALFLQADAFARGEALAKHTKHVELNQDPSFNDRFVEALGLG